MYILYVCVRACVCVCTRVEIWKDLDRYLWRACDIERNRKTTNEKEAIRKLPSSKKNLHTDL